MRSRFMQDESGFTLSEMMVTTMLMIMVVFALYNIFDMSLRVYSFGNDKVEAAENARLGLAKIERELRAAYPVNGYEATGSSRYRFFNANGVASAPSAQMPSATQLTFGNELGSASDDRILCGSPCEYITYKLTSTASPTSACTTATAPCTLRRVNAASSSGAGEPVVDFIEAPDTVAPIDPNQYGLRFRYFADTTTGSVEINPLSPGTRTQADIDRVEIALQVDVDGRTQELFTEVKLRNEG